MTRRRTTPRNNADGAWKRVLTDLLPDVIAFSAPELHAAIDWTVPPVPLDKEFQAIVRQAAIGPRVADHLVQLRLQSGEITWLVLHVEVQGQPEEDFAARMFTYYALLHLRLWRRQREAPGEPPLILGLALLTDAQPTWRPGPYQARAFERGVRYDYWVVKLLDWRTRQEELTASSNPFALVVQAWLGVQAARRRTDDLFAIARAAYRHLRRSGYSDETVATILAFLEQIMTLPPLLQDQLLAEVADEEEETMAQVMSRFEREGMRKGRQQGRQEGRQQGRQEGQREERLTLALVLLNHRLGTLDEATTEHIHGLENSQLLALYTAALDFTDRAELDRWLAENAA